LYIGKTRITNQGLAAIERRFPAINFFR
jgi:hypothetical protein